MYFADLHVHTNVSDCSMSAENILKKAKKSGITHIAFTDHDTTQCAFEHQRLAAEFGIQAIPAVEMSAYDYEGKRKVHILGYGYKTTEHIEAIGSETLRKRHENCLRQIHILNNIGYQVPVEEVQKMAGDCIYKQHILDYLLKTGQSKSLLEIYTGISLKMAAPVILILPIRTLQRLWKRLRKMVERLYWHIRDSKRISISFHYWYSQGLTESNGIILLTKMRTRKK